MSVSYHYCEEPKCNWNSLIPVVTKVNEKPKCPFCGSERLSYDYENDYEADNSKDFESLKEQE